MGLVDELQKIADDKLFANVGETDWVSKGLSEKDKIEAKEEALKEFNKFKNQQEG